MKIINNASNVKVIKNNELKTITGGGPGKWLPWLQPAFDFATGLAKGAGREGNRNKWKNV